MNFVCTKSVVRQNGPPATGQRAVSRVAVAAAAKLLSAPLTSAEDFGTASSSSRQSSGMVDVRTFDFHDLRLGPATGVLCDGGGGCCSLTTADCCARLPPAMLVCNSSRLKSYRADRSSRGRTHRFDWRSGGRSGRGVGCGSAGRAAAAGCWPSSRFFDSWMAAYRSMADRPGAGRAATGAAGPPRPPGGSRTCAAGGLGRWTTRIGDMLSLLMSMRRPAPRSSFTGVDAADTSSRGLQPPASFRPAADGGVPTKTSRIGIINVRTLSNTR